MAQKINDALGVSGTSTAFYTISNGEVWISVDGTYGGETFTLQNKNSEGTWETFTMDASASTVLFDGSTYGKHRKLNLPGGFEFRLNGNGAGSGTDVNVKIDGVIRVDS